MCCLLEWSATTAGVVVVCEVEFGEGPNWRVYREQNRKGRTAVGRVSGHLKDGRADNCNQAIVEEMEFYWSIVFGVS